MINWQLCQPVQYLIYLLHKTNESDSYVTLKQQTSNVWHRVPTHFRQYWDTIPPSTNTHNPTMDENPLTLNFLYADFVHWLLSSSSIQLPITEASLTISKSFHKAGCQANKVSKQGNNDVKQSQHIMRSSSIHFQAILQAISRTFSDQTITWLTWCITAASPRKAKWL